ncbi:MAG TPA: hypothetical protein VF756_09500 [Thermoanaerobaculia bacterium]
MSINNPNQRRYLEEQFENAFSPLPVQVCWEQGDLRVDIEGSAPERIPAGDLSLAVALRAIRVWRDVLRRSGVALGPWEPLPAQAREYLLQIDGAALVWVRRGSQTWYEIDGVPVAHPEAVQLLSQIGLVERFPLPMKDGAYQQPLSETGRAVASFLRELLAGAPVPPTLN